MRPGRRRRILLGIVWLAFVLRGLFYCVQQPMWEGYDEWAHFAYLQHVGEYGKIPSRTDPVSAQVQQSLLLVPLPAAAAGTAGTITHDSFWRLPPDQRKSREEQLRNLRSGGRAVSGEITALQYEAQQPPLYYVVLAPVYLLVRHLSLPAQVLICRLASVLIASSVVFLGYGAALLVLGNPAPALLTAVLLAVLPGLYIDVCRIGNEGLAIVLVSAVLLYALRVCQSPARRRDWLVLGALMGGALLTKAYALALVPLLPLVALVRVLRSPRAWKSTAIWCLAALATAAAIAGWWYWRVWMATGTLSGEQLDIAAAAFTFTQKLSAARHMDWRAAADVGAFTHIWTGGWSFLGVRSWMYRVCELVALLAATGLLVYAVRAVRGIRRSTIPAALGEPVILAAGYAFMVLAVAYHSVLVFLTRNINTAMGWYLYAVVVPEAVLLVLGLRTLFGKRWSPAAIASVCALAIALDLYTAHFLLMPYYTGMISHRASGSLESLRIGTLVTGMDVLFQRLSVNEPAGVGPLSIKLMWVAYVCSTVALGVMAVFTASASRQPSSHFRTLVRGTHRN